MASHGSLYHHIVELEERTWQALQKSGAALKPFLTEDCMMNFPLGIKVTSDSVPSLAEILESPGYVPWKSFQLGNVDVVPLGPDGAVISYLAYATRPPLDPEASQADIHWEALCSSVWRKEHGKYRMCFHQQTLTT